MSQIILDDQLADIAIRGRLAQWTRAQRLRDLRPGEVIKDERVPTILRELRQPTFVTIDTGFWNARLRDARYCILCFPLRSDEQRAIPGLLRHLLRLPEFATKAARMGKVARISQSHIDYWQLGDEQPHRLSWPPVAQRKGGVIREQGPAYEFEAPEALAAEDQPPDDADIADLRYCSAFGSTPDEVLREVQIAKQAWLEAAMASGKPIPEPRYHPVIYQLAA